MKKFLILIPVICLFVGLVGCTPDKEPEAPLKTEPADAPKTGGGGNAATLDMDK